MFASHNPAIHELLQEQRLIDPEQLKALDGEHKATGRPLADLAVDLGLVERETLLQSIARHLGYDFLRVMPEQLPCEAIAAITGGMARDYGVVPLSVDERNIALVVSDPFNTQTVDDLTFALDRHVRLVVADPDQVDVRIRRHYGGDETSSNGLLQAIESDTFSEDEARELSERDLESMAGRTPIVRFVNRVIAQAIRDQASDIHFEPFEHDFKVRCRIDGVLHELAPPSKALALPIISRIKVLASLNIAERRLPQDGRIKVQLGRRAVDLRVSTLPTQFGESVVLRVLDQAAVQLNLGQLGMPDDVLGGIQEIIRRPNGIFIATGPTGSGKTTTLYSCLRVINTVNLKFLTAEDPVEYEIDGIMQVPVKPHAGLTFASALRSFLRQDPDVIMVGEIRDLETAQISIQAALTGHLVLTTLHTNDAAGTITRLIDMGVEPFLVASTLEGVLAQRLVRRVCTRCKTAYQPPPDLLAPLNLDGAGAGSGAFFHGPGCPACSQSGYLGRLGIYEWLRLSEPLRDLITARVPTMILRQKAMEHGMRTLREDGLRAIFDGQTSVEEIIKCTC
ncbi:MAG: GspE/PulE family protein [Opitutus sp.]